MKPRRRLTLWNYYLAWISVNALAWAAGFGAAQLYARLLYSNDRFIQRVLEGASYIWTRPLDSPIAAANYGLMLGAAVGLGQWYVLRRRIDIKWQFWLAATAFGFALHGLLLGLDVNLIGGPGPAGEAALTGELSQGAALGSIGLLCSGIVVVGLLQWLVLRRNLPRAGWWVLVSTAALLLASPDRSGGTSSLPGWVAVTLLAGAVYGIVTAFGLFFLIPEVTEEEDEAEE